MKPILLIVSPSASFASKDLASSTVAWRITMGGWKIECDPYICITYVRLENKTLM